MQRRNSHRIAFVLVLVTCVASGAIASKATKFKQQIQSVYNEADAAASRNNAPGAVAHYADLEMRIKTQTGLSKLLAVTISPVFTSTITSITLTPENPVAAIVIVQQRFHGLIHRANGKMALAGYEAKVREYWAKGPVGWQVLRSRLLSSRRTLNSKPVSSW